MSVIISPKAIHWMHYIWISKHLILRNKPMSKYNKKFNCDIQLAAIISYISLLWTTTWTISSRKFLSQFKIQIKLFRKNYAVMILAHIREVLGSKSYQNVRPNWGISLVFHSSSIAKCSALSQMQSWPLNFSVCYLTALSGSRPYCFDDRIPKEQLVKWELE